jgi:hypothetical protein
LLLDSQEKTQESIPFCEELVKGGMGYPRVQDRQQPLKAFNRARETEKKNA